MRVLPVRPGARGRGDAISVELSTIGVQALYRPEIVVEIEGTAVID